MTETPRVLSETPPARIDLLSDLLGSMHLSGAVLFHAIFRDPWGLAAPDAERLSQMLPLNTEHIIPFHIVATGSCWLERKEGGRIRLMEGDAVLLPYGESHDLAGDTAAENIPAEQFLPPPPWPEVLTVEHGGSGPATHIVCGFLQCDELLFHPLLSHLPALLYIHPGSSADDRWLAATIRHTAEIAAAGGPGSRSMLSRLTEVIFLEILRKHMQALSADEVGWLAAANDPVVGNALRCLHAAPLDDWNVHRLAQRAGVSRTVLAERFKHFLDMPPMHYLTYWRLHLAADGLKRTTAPLKAIASQAGYESEAAFSRAFKRHFGLPPADWRRRQQPG